MNEWKAPGKKTITKCAVNQRQVVVALSGRELVYFEMDPVSFPPNEFSRNAIELNDPKMMKFVT